MTTNTTADDKTSATTDEPTGDVLRALTADSIGRAALRRDTPGALLDYETHTQATAAVRSGRVEVA